MNESDCPRAVLIVDDDAAIRESISEVLEDAEYCPMAVANGQEALDYLRKGYKPCLILLDLMMPIMDGWQFRAEQLADPALGPIPVVVLSAVNNLDHVDAGAHLHKPIQLQTLLDIVARFCAPSDS
jgi:CheY-like chemotaxis protein